HKLKEFFAHQSCFLRPVFALIQLLAIPFCFLKVGNHPSRAVPSSTTNYPIRNGASIHLPSTNKTVTHPNPLDVPSVRAIDYRSYGTHAVRCRLQLDHPVPLHLRLA